MSELALTNGDGHKPAKLKAVAKAEAAPVATSLSEAASVMRMIDRLIADPSITLERMNQAFDFYQKIKADAARQAFDAAMADAKAEFTPVIKRQLVEYGEDKKKTAYKHESLLDISSMVDPILAKHGLSYRYRTSSNINEPVRVTCVVAHRDGYFEENSLCAGRDDSGGKNAIQSIGSTLTYLQRYSLKAALGLATGYDDDGKAAGSGKDRFISAAEAEEITQLISDTKSDWAKFQETFDVDAVSDLTVEKYTRAVAILKKKAASK